MPCFSRRRRGQSDEVRRKEIEKATQTIGDMLAAQRVKMVVGPQGAVGFVGIPDSVRDDMTDECVYRELQKQGSPAMRMALMRAEMLAGRKMNPASVNAGTHTHDGGLTWHPRG